MGNISELQKNEKRLRIIDNMIMAGVTALLIIAICMLFASCTTPEKRIYKQHILHPLQGAEVCSKLYPPRTEYKQTIEYRQGKNDTIWQAEYIDCDTVIGHDRIVKVQYPVIVPSRDTLVFRDSVFIENKAEISRLKLEMDSYHAKAEKYKQRGKNLLLGGILIGAGFIFVMLVMLKKPF